MTAPDDRELTSDIEQWHKDPFRYRLAFDDPQVRVELRRYFGLEFGDALNVEIVGREQGLSMVGPVDMAFLMDEEMV